MLKYHALWLVCGLSVFYAVVEPVQAGAVAELRLADLTGAPMDAPASGFSPGDQFLVELWLKPDQDIVAREIKVDYRASSPELIPGLGIDIDTVNQPLDGVPNFWFDYTNASPFGTYPASGIVELFPGFFPSTTADYSDASNLISTFSHVAEPVSAVAANSRPGGNLTTYTDGTFTRVGGMPITIPNDISAGVYLVDLLNSPDGIIYNYANGSSIMFGFSNDPEDPITIWAAATDDPSVDDSLAYAPGAGPFEFAIAPEPTSLLLFACGICFAMGTVRKRDSYA